MTKSLSMKTFSLLLYVIICLSCSSQTSTEEIEANLIGHWEMVSINRIDCEGRNITLKIFEATNGCIDLDDPILACYTLIVNKDLTATLKIYPEGDIDRITTLGKGKFFVTSADEIKYCEGTAAELNSIDGLSEDELKPCLDVILEDNRIELEVQEPYCTSLWTYKKI